MKTAKFEYKCRRCNKIEVNPCTSENNARMLLMHILHGYNVLPHFCSIPPKIKEIHSCEDGGCGVKDLIGYRIEN